MQLNPNEIIPVRVQVGSKLLLLKVPRKKEEYVRLAARLVTKRMDDFKQYEVGEPEDRLAWTALDYTTDLVEHLRTKESINTSVFAEIENLEALLHIH